MVKPDDKTTIWPVVSWKEICENVSKNINSDQAKTVKSHISFIKKKLTTDWLKGIQQIYSGGFIPNLDRVISLCGFDRNDLLHLAYLGNMLKDLSNKKGVNLYLIPDLKTPREKRFYTALVEAESMYRLSRSREPVLEYLKQETKKKNEKVVDFTASIDNTVWYIEVSTILPDRHRFEYETLDSLRDELSEPVFDCIVVYGSLAMLSNEKDIDEFKKRVRKVADDIQKKKKIDFEFLGTKLTFVLSNQKEIRNLDASSSGPQITMKASDRSLTRNIMNTICDKAKKFTDSSRGVIFIDIGSGLNMKRRGLRRLLALAQSGAIDTLLITHRDRLARFGVDLLQRIFEDYGVKLIILMEEEDQTPQEELVTDMMALIASFSGRVYGLRAAALRAQ